MPKFDLKNTLLGIFDQKCLVLVIFGKKCRKPIVIFKISILNFVNFQNFAKKTNRPKLRTKKPDLCILGLQIEINIVIFEMSTLQHGKF